MGGAVFPPCCLTRDQTVVGEMKIVVTSFKKSHALLHSVPPALPQATADPRPCGRLLDTHRQAWLSLEGSLLLSPGSWCAQSFVCALQGSVSQVLCKLASNPTGLQSQIPRGFSVPLPDPQIGKSVVVPRNFLTMWAFLWYNCSAVCGVSAWQLCGGVIGDLLQEGLATYCVTQVCCTQSPWPYCRSLLTCTSAVWNAVLGCNVENDKKISVGFQGRPFIQYHSNPSLCPNQ